MSEHKSADRRGEGFAFFRWHMLKWKDEWCWCKQHPDYLCYKLWKMPNGR